MTSTGRPIARAMRLAPVGGREAAHAAALGEQVGDVDDRARERVATASRTPADEAGRHQAGVEAARADDDRVEPGDRLGRGRVDRRVRLEPDALDDAALALAGVDLGLAARRRPVGVGGAQRRALGAHRPDPAAAAEQPAQAVDGGEEVAAVLLHHRQQQVAAGVPGQAARARASAAATAARGGPRPRCGPAPART